MKKQLTLKEIAGAALGIVGLVLVFAIADSFIITTATKLVAVPVFIAASKLMED